MRASVLRSNQGRKATRTERVAYRRRGIGAELARRVWLQCPGKWRIRVMEKNVLARRFWEPTITKLTGLPAHSSKFVADSLKWCCYSLDSRR
jgi:hypothetical protein